MEQSACEFMQKVRSTDEWTIRYALRGFIDFLEIDQEDIPEFVAILEARCLKTIASLSADLGSGCNDKRVISDLKIRGTIIRICKEYNCA